MRIEFTRPSDHLHSNAELVEQLVRNFETASAESKQNAHSSREMKQVTDTVEANARARPSTSIADATEPQKYHESLDNLPHSPGRGRALKKVRSRYSHSAEDFETARRGGLWQDIGLGLFATLSNPKAILFFGALMPTLIDMTAVAAVDLFVLSARLSLVSHSLDFSFQLVRGTGCLHQHFL